MILTNEQRAHDLVISLFPEIVAEQRASAREKALVSSTPIKSINVTKLYVQVYKDTLKTLEEFGDNL